MLTANRFPCDFRGDITGTQRCGTCGPDKNREIDVYQCHELGTPCSIHAHNLRIGNSRTGPKMPVCIRCDVRTVDGVRQVALGAVEIQRVQRAVEATRPVCALQQRFSANVARIRSAAGLSIAAAATAAGCNVLLWNKIESAEHWPSPERLDGIAAAMGVPAAAFFV